MLRKFSRTNSRITLLAVVALASCGEAPSSIEPPTEAELSQAPARGGSPVEGFKFLRLGMNLEELHRHRASDFDPDLDLVCKRDAETHLCYISEQSLAGTDAVVYAYFLATPPVQEPARVSIPPLHEVTQQEIRMGNAYTENSKRDASIKARNLALAKNRDRELKSLAQFRLANMVVKVDADQADTVRQALEDRYGPPRTYEVSGITAWSGSETSLLFERSPIELSLVYNYRPMKPQFDQYLQRLRQERASDL